MTDPTGVRISVTGNVLDIPNPRSVWSKHFGDLLPVRVFLRLVMSTFHGHAGV